MQLNIDSIIFIIFLLTNIIVGLISSRGIKNIKEYAIGERKFSTATIAATIVATWIGGENFFIFLSETYNDGLYFIWTAVGYVFGIFIIGAFFAPRLKEFLGNISIAEAMGRLYGDKVRVITAIAGIVGTGGIIAVQLKVAGELFEYCFEMPQIYGVVIGGIIVTLYSALGGIRSVTFTDVIQIFTFGTIVPLIAFFIISRFENMDIFINTISNNKLFDPSEVFDLTSSKALSFIPLFLFMAIPSFDPPIFQRIAMASNVEQIRKSFVVGSILCLLITITISWIAVLILSDRPDLEANNIVKHIIFDYAHPGIRGIIIAGIMAMLMSTADSYINSTSILLVHDICKPLGLRMKNELFFSRISSLMVGGIATLFAMREGSLLDLLLSAYFFYMPIVTVPFIVSILGFRTNDKSIIVGMVGGFITVISWQILNIESMEPLLPGMIVNLTCLFATHYLLTGQGGWVKPIPTYDRSSLKKKPKIIPSLVNEIKNFNLKRLILKNTPNQDNIYIYIAFFCMVTIYTTMHSLPKAVSLEYPYFIEFIFASSLFFSTLLLIYPLWLKEWQGRTLIASAIGNFVIFYVLICSNFAFVIISAFSAIQIMVFVINLIVIASLFRWQWLLFLLISGMLITLQLIKIYVKPNLLLDAGLLKLKVTYLLLLLSSILVVFIKPKQKYEELTKEKNEHLKGRIESSEQQVQDALAVRSEFLRNVTHEYNTPMTGITSLAETLWHSFDSLPENELKKGLEYIFKSANRLKNFEENISSISTISKTGFELEKHTVDLGKLVGARIDVCRRFYEENKEEREFYVDIKDNLIIDGDEYYLIQTIDNLIINAITYCPNGNIKIVLRQDQQQKNAILIIKDEGIGIFPEELYDIFADFVVSSKTKTPAGGRGLGLALCKRVIELHKGTILAESDGIKGAKFIITLPLP